jgi:hypothetical protein
MCCSMHFKALICFDRIIERTRIFYIVEVVSVSAPLNAKTANCFYVKPGFATITTFI